jgi:superfamily II DNA or RNA helicase
MLSRNEELQGKLLAAREWDLVVCDEAHRMSASFFGSEVKYTQRYQLGQRLSGRTRHFLLMTATPHNGKEADFQLFMGLLDGDLASAPSSRRRYSCASVGDRTGIGHR